MRNTDTLDEQVKVEEGASHHKDALTYTHPSYGMINFSRQTCSGEGAPLFGSKHPSSNIMSLTIKKASNTQDLGKNWYYGHDTITKVLMTPIQYSELISNPNTSGVPCTIKYTNAEGYIKYRPHATEVDHLDVKIKDKLSRLSGVISGKKAKAKEILTRKGTLKKKDKEDLLRLFEYIDQDMQHNLPWYKEQMEKSLNSMINEANSDIESLVNSVQTSLGKKILDNPELLNKILGDNTLLLEDNKEA